MKTKKKNRGKWRDSYYVKIFRLAKAGLGDMKIAQAMQIEYMTFYNWKKSNKTLRLALKEARKKDAESESYQEYVYNRLAPDLRETWDTIMECETNPNVIARVERMLSEAGKIGRQHLFINAMIHFNFNLSEACRVINISRDEFDRWVLDDPKFQRLIEELDWHKKNFFEGSLIELVKEKDKKAIMFVNSTYNADRGYGRKQVIEKNVKHSGTVKHEHKPVPIDALGLSLKEKKKLLEGYRRADKNSSHEG